VVAAGVVGANQDGGAEPRPARSAVVTTTTTAPTVSVPPGPPPTALPAAEPAPVPPEQAKVLVSPRGVVVPVEGHGAGGFRVHTPCGRTAVVRSGTPLGAADVVLDPGHGGDEAGATGPGGFTEKELNLAVATHAKQALARAGVTSVLTRTGDYRMTLGARARVALALRPKAFVSIHHNAEPDGPRPGPGTETYRQLASDDSKRLSGLVYEEVVNALSAYSVAWVADTDAGAKYRASSRGDDYYGILRRTKGVPAVLAELAFISNRPEEALLKRPDVQRVEGEAVARGILRYLNTKDPGSGFVEPYPRDSPAGPGGDASGCVDPGL
jgi:N-acetylmuramoyl-L-alanine amidase